MNIHSYSVAHEAIEALTRRMADRMLGSAGSFHVALSGGETAKRLFPFWSGPFADRLDWDRIRFYWVDERCVPPDDPQSNFGTAERLLFSPLTVPASHVHRIRGEQPPETEAERYTHLIGQELSGLDDMPRFDCIVLGIGEDMHTASIFSETSFLLTAEPGYRVSIHPRSAQMRITMTGSLILAARLLLVPMLGERKIATARHLAERPNDRSPAGCLAVAGRTSGAFRRRIERMLCKKRAPDCCGRYKFVCQNTRSGCIKNMQPLRVPKIGFRASRAVERDSR